MYRLFFLLILCPFLYSQDLGKILWGEKPLTSPINFDYILTESKNINYKILVSGTGMGFTKSSLKKKLGPNFNPKLIQCCIDLDGVSKNTLTNASETFKWAYKNDIKEFILITSNYHMPRAILEFKNVMPNLKIYTHAITPKKHDIENWLSSYQTFSLVFTEYCKFIIAGLRIKFFST